MTSVAVPHPQSHPSADASPPPHDGEGKPTRVLFLNTRDQCGADVAVHLSLIRSFDPQRTQVHLLSNSRSVDAAVMHDFCQGIPGLHYRFLPLGMPAPNAAGQGGMSKSGAVLPISASLLRAAAYIRRHRIDIIHATDRPRDAVFSSLLSRLTRTPNVVHMHSNAGPHISRASRWGLHSATSLFAVSAATRQEMVDMGLPAEKIAVVHNATDPTHFDPSKTGDAGALTRNRFGIPPRAPVLGIVARLNPWKGQQELIEAVAALTPSHPDLRLMVLGTGETEEALRRQAAEFGLNERVLFLGWQEDVRPYLSAMDLFCLPSYAEPFGLAITEAMSMALPVIACHSGGVPEIIDHGEHGWLITPRSVEQLSSAIQLLLARPDLRGELGRRARRRIQERFTPNQQSTLVSHLYDGIARCHRTPHHRTTP